MKIMDNKTLLTETQKTARENGGGWKKGDRGEGVLISEDGSAKTDRKIICFAASKEVLRGG